MYYIAQKSCLLRKNALKYYADFN